MVDLSVDEFFALGRPRLFYYVDVVVEAIVVIVVDVIVENAVLFSSSESLS